MPTRTPSCNSSRARSLLSDSGKNIFQPVLWAQIFTGLLFDAYVGIHRVRILVFDNSKSIPCILSYSLIETIQNSIVSYLERKITNTKPKPCKQQEFETENKVWIGPQRVCIATVSLVSMGSLFITKAHYIITTIQFAPLCCFRTK